MVDTYQAIYDAVRSKMSGGDIGEVIRQVAFEKLDISHAVDMVRHELLAAAHEQSRPAVVMKPRVFADGDMWCALYGEDIAIGVCGFGKTPAEATANFDIEWWKGQTPAAKFAAASKAGA